jgi:hypothetical protein
MRVLTSAVKEYCFRVLDAPSQRADPLPAIHVEKEAIRLRWTEPVLAAVRVAALRDRCFGIGCVLHRVAPLRRISNRSSRFLEFLKPTLHVFIDTIGAIPHVIARSSCRRRLGQRIMHLPDRGRRAARASHLEVPRASQP